MMREPYLRKKPPKTAGREQFGQEYARRIIRMGQETSRAAGDLVRTATVFTALSIADAFRQIYFAARARG